LEAVYNISKKINSKAMPLKAFWLGKRHLLCRWSFTAKRKPPALQVVCYSLVGQTGVLMKIRKARTDDAAAPLRREDEKQREKEVCNGRQRQEG